VQQLSVDLSGKRAIVTGASSGIGRHFAIALARSGARVALAARRSGALQAVADEIKANGGHAVAVRLDVTDELAVRSVVESVVRELGGIDILVNSSGLAITRPLLEQTTADWDTVVNTNLRGAFLMATEVARHMRDSGRPGSIINIASILGLRQSNLVAPYAVSKAGLIQLTKEMALELARFNIRVNALAPGYVLTDINRDFFATEAGTAMIRRVPQRRLGQLADLEGPFLLLASDASSYMTGAIVVADGGHLLSSL
jgi:NAD(P)-dependent dehydrogenase (short-subunit alcohol dehydrogenase family)